MPMKNVMDLESQCSIGGKTNTSIVKELISCLAARVSIINGTEDGKINSNTETGSRLAQHSTCLRDDRL